MVDPHRLSAAAFAELAGGGADAAGLAVLRAAGLSRHLLLLREIVRATGGQAETWYAVLAAADERAPARVRRILAYPQVGAWAAACLGGLRAGRSPRDAGAGRLGAVAAVAALAAGLDAPVAVPFDGGMLVLPGLGAVPLSGAGEARVHTGTRMVEAGAVRVAVPDDPTSDAPGWWALRRLSATYDGLRLTLLLDDLDPYRAGHGLAPAGRLTDGEVRAWQEHLDGAWRLLVTRHRRHAEAIAAGLTSIVPLRGDPAHRGISATSRDAFGAVAMSVPADAVALAVGLLHEFQHGKLNAVQYLFDLHQPAGDRVYSPWRDDPRPLGGLLHGAYAYLAVAGFWRVERRSGDPVADFEFARWRAAVAAATDALLAAEHLTPTGVRFVTAMRGRVRPWLAEPVPPVVAGFAERANTDHRLRWRLRNVPVDPRLARALALAWRAGGPPPGPVSPAGVRAGARALERSARLDLVHARLRDPHAQFGPVAPVDPAAPPDSRPGPAVPAGSRPDPAAPPVPAASRPDPAVPAAPRESGDPAYGPGDRAYARGDPAAAARAYRTAVARRPDDDAAWAGLALTDPGLGPVLRARPELMAAVYRAACVPGRPAPDLDALAAWLGPALRTP
jgi:HEXXH motif-containing protein